MTQVEAGQDAFTSVKRIHRASVKIDPQSFRQKVE